MKLPYRKTRDGIILDIRVEPRSSSAGIQGSMGNTVKIRLTSPPVGGAANKQLIEILSKELGIGKRSFIIIKGERSKTKVVKIVGREHL